MNILSSVARTLAFWSSDSALAKLDSSRLSDLGLNAYDIRDSRKIGRSQRAQFFSDRRNERASAWLR